MRKFIGVFRCEYFMSTRRLSLWVIFGLLMIPYVIPVFTPTDMQMPAPTDEQILAYAGTLAYMLNVFMPVVGGILAADRLVRDRKTGVNELLESTPTDRRIYLAGKYFGTLFSVTTPVLLTSVLEGVAMVAYGGPWKILPAMLLAFLGINLPAYAFITAFSLACPLVIPVRVYQVLFTGYWFWGNFLSPKVMPTLNGTYLTPSGHFVLYGMFGGFFSGGGLLNGEGITAGDAWINLAVLAVCAALALLAAERYLTLQAHRA